MSEETLRKNLERLHQELAAVEELDDDSRALLKHVAEDIERVLAGNAPHAATLADQVEEVAVKFEVDHPQLAHALSEITNTLSRLGV